jgi:hypothetical protein
LAAPLFFRQETPVISLRNNNFFTPVRAGFFAPKKQKGTIKVKPVNELKIDAQVLYFFTFWCAGHVTTSHPTIFGLCGIRG